jgi:hypothetical protein
MNALYEIYLKHYYWKPISFDHFKYSYLHGATMEDIIMRWIYRFWILSEIEYNNYKSECDDLYILPYSKWVYEEFNRKGRNVFPRSRSYLNKETNISDMPYILKIKPVHCKRKSTINQNFCLFYKNYFKRKTKQSLIS